MSNCLDLFTFNVNLNQGCPTNCCFIIANLAFLISKWQKHKEKHKAIFDKSQPRLSYINKLLLAMKSERERKN